MPGEEDFGRKVTGTVEFKVALTANPQNMLNQKLLTFKEHLFHPQPGERGASKYLGLWHLNFKGMELRTGTGKTENNFSLHSSSSTPGHGKEAKGPRQASAGGSQPERAQAKPRSPDSEEGGSTGGGWRPPERRELCFLRQSARPSPPRSAQSVFPKWKHLAVKGPLEQRWKRSNLFLALET